ncbi:D-glycero-D-manno-heptose 1,7-bisphosphate phosphatase [Duganella sp. 3397]|uniref:D-glycero-beta-D-manno-heptose 1,7-bisphosphate 7-phosphatase n=1 Tax=Duganella sp. 3397 TaxID=2817732 RepID=UPI00285F0C85|nr:D-glycero-beta-D-manno-heptose 1,7-bisphosphate 7-phosphatase [Duganella sp. 3397]MDR7050428.1 D-glycero-D-manno-heptose 1,7-bisphosphate phosphatase [Duganella sp. 3397]
MGAPAFKLIILDRDGVINHDSPDFIKSPAEWIPVPGSLEAIARLNQAGYRVVVASNQSGIARELFDMVTLNAIHHKMHSLAQQVGADIDAVFFCPHSAADNCDCRKPKPGMFTEIAQRYKVSLKGVPVVGDSLRDLQAGYVSGCTPYLVLTGKGEKTQATGGLPPGTQVFADLAAMVAQLLKTAAAPAPAPAINQ